MFMTKTHHKVNSKYSKEPRRICNNQFFVTCAARSADWLPVTAGERADSAATNHISVEDEDFELSPKSHFHKKALTGKSGCGFLWYVFVMNINYNWLHQLINLYSLTKTTTKWIVCRDMRLNLIPKKSMR